MLKSLGDLSGKSMDLQEALKLQFAKTNKLMNTTNVTVSGNIQLRPAAAVVEAPKPAADAKPAAEKKWATSLLKEHTSHHIIAIVNFAYRYTLMKGRQKTPTTVYLFVLFSNNVCRYISIL